MDDYLLYVRAFAALIFVLALLGVIAYFGRRFSGVRLVSPKRQRRVGVIEVTAIDPKRRLVLVRRDETEHLLLIGGGQDLVIESGIAKPVSASVPESTISAPPAPRSRLDEVRF